MQKFFLNGETSIAICKLLRYIIIITLITERGKEMKAMMMRGCLYALLLLLCGCYFDDNNYLTPRDFATRLEEAGIKVTSVRDVPGAPFKATSGAAVMVEKSEIGIYKYDRSSKVQRERISKRKRTGRAYINGIPYPVEVHGSFMFLGLEKNPRKHDIIKVIRRFY